MKVRELIELTREHGTGMLLLIQYSNYFDSEVDELLDGVDITDNKEWFWIPLKLRLDYYKEKERIKFSKKIRGEL